MPPIVYLAAYGISQKYGDLFYKRLPSGNYVIYINGKTNCSLFSKHFAQDFVLLTQNKMYILLFPIICFSDFVLSLLLLS